jgi:GMP synthase-like glutamine amidotransferase
MKIGILQTGQSPDVLKNDMGDYPDMFERLLAGRGLTFRTWHVENMDFPAGVHDADGWLITGSRHGAYEDHPFIPPLEDFIRRAYAERVPIVGICFGHQIVAQALGGRVEKYAGGWSVGPTEYEIEGEKVLLNAWHQDQVVKAPEGAKVIGSSAFCENAALVYDDVIFTVQPHPEFPDEFIDGLMRTRGKGRVPDDLMARAAERLGRPNASPRMADRIADFFKQPRS